MSGRAGASHRRATIVVGGLLVLLALTLLSIGANSPYTHANLNPGYDERYQRTEQIVMGAAPAFPGFGGAAPSQTADQATRGYISFVSAGCFGCHGLEGRGGAVAKPIAGVDQTLLMQQVRQGTVTGMPVFTADKLTDEQVADIGAYLRSLPAASR